MYPLIIAILVFSLLFILLTRVYETISFKNFVEKGKDPEKNELYSKYYELKFNLRVLEFFGVVALFVLSFLGYNTQKSIEDNFRNELKDISDKVIKAENSLNVIDSSARYIESVSLKSNILLKQSVNKLTDVNKLIDSKQFVYIVKNLDAKKSEFKFSELKKPNGIGLPKFETLPYVSILNTCNKAITLKETTTIGFTIFNEVITSHDDCDVFSFDIIIYY
jgi:hypothetical protein